LSLATEFAGDKMTTVNFFGLVLCLIGISVHVVIKATKGRCQYKKSCTYIINVPLPQNPIYVSKAPIIGPYPCWERSYWYIFP